MHMYSVMNKVLSSTRLEVPIQLQQMWLSVSIQLKILLAEVQWCQKLSICKMLKCFSQI